MPTIADYVVITDAATTLPAGNVQAFPFDAPAVNAGSKPLLLFRVFPSVGAGLELTINGAVVFTLPAFADPAGRSLHEVVASGLVLAAGNVLTATNTGAASLNISDVVLLFQ